MISPLQCKLGRTALGWTAHVLGERAHVSANSISQFERGKVKPNPATIAGIQRALEDAGVIFLTETEREGVLVNRRR
jgi:transcriptional regulator with XRE-family HTH domain